MVFFCLNALKGNWAAFEQYHETFVTSLYTRNFKNAILQYHRGSTILQQMQIRRLAQSAVFPATNREAFDITEKSKVQPTAALAISTFWLCGCGLLSGGCYSHVIIHIPYMPETCVKAEWRVRGQNSVVVFGQVLD